MADEPQRLQNAIAALEAQRGLLGDAVVETALAPLRARLDLLQKDSDQALRQVSILFLDIVGSTTLSQRLDPEEIHAVMDGALARLTAVVQAHHGKVLQYAGDNLLAVFGAERSQERDAENAVLCGLAMLDEGRALGRQVQATHGHEGFDVRVGVHSGGVLLGGGVDGEGTIRGIAVNIAARMEQTAPAGALRISQDSWHQVRGMFDVDLQPPLAVKGVDAPVHSVLVRRAKPRALRIAARGIEGVATRMIGRQQELQALQSAFSALPSDPRLVMLTVVADAGVGKSRLLVEFQAWSQNQPQLFFRGRAHPHSQNQPYGLLRDLLASHFEIDDGDSPARARQQLAQGIVPLFEADDGPAMAQGHADILAHLLGMDASDSPHVRAIAGDARQLRNRAFHVVAQLFRRLSQGRGLPLVLALEDLHWADDASLDLLDLLAELDADLPMLVIALTRPTLFERRSEWPRQRARHRRIDLVPLGAGQAREFAHELLQRLPEVPPALQERLIVGAEGNPYFMEELVKMLIDQGAIETGAERWTLHPDRLQATRVPGTLTGVLQARLDGLPALERKALQQASVIGAVFWDQALHALDETIAEALPPLMRRELVLRRPGSSLEGLREYGFRHHLLHQVTYDSLLKRHRRELHGRLAHWLSAQAGSRAGEWLGLTADHYDKAGDAANAAEFHARAAAHARERHVPETALLHVQRALALLEALPASRHAELRWRLNETGEAAFSVLGRRSEQRACLNTMQALADTMDDDARRALVARRCAFLGMRVADYRLQEASARQAMALAEKLQDGENRTRALRMLAAALDSQERPDEARALALQGLADARAGGWRHVEAEFYNTLYSIAANEGDIVAALRYNLADLALCQSLGDRLSEAVVLCNVAECWMEFGDLTQARHWLDDSLQHLRAVGERTVESSALSNLSQLALWQGNHVQALHQAQAALALAEAVEAPDYVVKALLRLGEAELALGRPALDSFARARHVADEGGHATRFEAAAGQALAALAEGDLPAALLQVGPLLDQWRGGAGFAGALRPRWVLAACHRVLRAAGDPRAPAMLDEARAQLRAIASRIEEAALRDNFLQRVPENRELLVG
jgi:predicted ATPase/class 3 adenylate cyclase